MASRELHFLSESDREKLIRELKGAGDLDYDTTPKEILEKAAALDGSGHVVEDFGTGCLACGEDDDHANILLCETCNAEYHTYCLSPPLRAVPVGDWYCAQCRMPTFEDDGLDKLVNALPPSFTARFGEIVWAQGGVGFGWWPAFIYDPRMTVGSARQLARKHLGKRHLVYFFECHDAPFSCVVDSKLATWDDGILEDYHMGKTAKASGRARIRLFQQAMQAASIEMGKPVELRMEFNHTDHPQILPSPQFKKPQRRILVPGRQKRLELNDLSPDSKPRNRTKVRGFPLLSDPVQMNPEKHQISVQRNLHRAMEVLAAAHSLRETDHLEDTELYCTLFMRKCDGKHPSNSLGFIKLPSRAKCTFEDARRAIETDVVPDGIAENQDWRFFVPSLGPMSRKQESTLGPLYRLLRWSSFDSTIGDGTLTNPLRLLVVVLEPSDGTEASYTDDSSLSKKSEM